MAAAWESSTVAATIAACARIRGTADLVIAVADVLRNCCGGGLLLYSGYHLLDWGSGVWPITTSMAIAN